MIIISLIIFLDNFWNKLCHLRIAESSAIEVGILYRSIQILIGSVKLSFIKKDRSQLTNRGILTNTAFYITDSTQQEALLTHLPIAHLRIKERHCTVYDTIGTPIKIGMIFYVFLQYRQCLSVFSVPCQKVSLIACCRQRVLIKDRLTEFLR